MGKDGPVGRTPKDIRSRGAGPDGFSGTQVSGRQIGGTGLFDQPRVLTSEEDAINKVDFASQEVADYFKGRELPTHVIAPRSVAYYGNFEDIPTESFPHRHGKTPIKIQAIELRAGISLEVYPPDEGESPDASFKFVGEKGLYVRVIRFINERLVGHQLDRTRVVSWMPYNEIKEDTDFKTVRLD